VVNNEAWRNWRPADNRELHAASLADGVPLRPALSLSRALAIGTCIGVASGADAKLREEGWALLVTALRRFEGQPLRSPHEAAAAFDIALDAAASEVFGDAVPAAGWGVAAAVLMPRWDVFCYARRGEAALWRRERRGDVRAIAHGHVNAFGSTDPLVMLGFGDRLLLVAGAAATIDRTAFAAGLGGFAPGRAASASVFRMALEDQASASASAMVVATPAGGHAIRAAYLSGVPGGDATGDTEEAIAAE